MTDHINHQPPPVKSYEDVVVNEVLADFQLRSARSAAEYGTPLVINNLRDGLVDAYQESMDKTMYLKQVLLELERYDFFAGQIQRMCRNAHLLSVNNGFWNNEKGRNVAEMLFLISSEIHELGENYRKGTNDLRSEKIIDFTTVEDELADVVLRIFDFAYGMNIRLGPAIVAKHEYNASRPPKHGVTGEGLIVTSKYGPGSVLEQ